MSPCLQGHWSSKLVDTFWYSTNPHFERPMVGRLNYSRPWTMLSLQPMGHVVDIVLDEREEVPDERMHSMRLQYTSAALRARVHDAHKGQCLRRVGSGHSPSGTTDPNVRHDHSQRKKKKEKNRSLEIPKLSDKGEHASSFSTTSIFARENWLAISSINRYLLRHVIRLL